jgi:hypothetical protein
MKPGSIVLFLSFLALGGATLASTVIVLDPLPQKFRLPARPQSAVLLVTPAGASQTRDAARSAAMYPATDRDFDVP